MPIWLYYPFFSGPDFIFIFYVYNDFHVTDCSNLHWLVLGVVVTLKR